MRNEVLGIVPGHKEVVFAGNVLHPAIPDRLDGHHEVSNLRNGVEDTQARIQ